MDSFVSLLFLLLWMEIEVSATTLMPRRVMGSRRSKRRTFIARGINGGQGVLSHPSLAWRRRSNAKNAQSIRSPQLFRIKASEEDNELLSDLYKRLEVEKGAPEKELKFAFRKLALKYHPDVNKAPDAEAQFQSIKLAYETLRNPEKRKSYLEQQRKAKSYKKDWTSGRNKKQESEEEFYGFNDFFMDLVRDEIKRNASKSTSLWDELGALGEEIAGDLLDVLEKEAEYLSKDLESADEVIRNTKVDPKLYKKYYRDPEETIAKMKAPPDPEEIKKQTEKEIDEMMEQLRKKIDSGSDATSR